MYSLFTNLGGATFTTHHASLEEARDHLDGVVVDSPAIRCTDAMREEFDAWLDENDLVVS